MASTVNSASLFPRAIRPAPEPLGLYFRPGRNDHAQMLNLIAAGDAACFGAVLEAKYVGKHTQKPRAEPGLPGICRDWGLGRHGELKEVLVQKRLDAILDPQTQQLAFPGSYSDALASLPWAHPDRPHRLADFEGQRGRDVVASLADFALEEKFTQVIAPTHVLESGDDPWLRVDGSSTRLLRNRLDQTGGAAIPIIYSLALPYSVFRDPVQRQHVRSQIRDLPITALWLKVDRFGASSSPTAIRAYIGAAAEFHELGVPVIADHTGGVIGLSLLALGAAGGLVHGLTLSERFNSYTWRKAGGKKGFSPATRVYLPSLDLHLSKKEAEALFSVSSRAKGLFGCADTDCCPRGIKDQVENPGRHFLYQRIAEVGALASIPQEMRPERFLDTTLRPMTDRALAAATINWENDKMAKKMQKNRKRLDALRVTLGDLVSHRLSHSFSTLPRTRAARER
jgi:hypothetical protein